MSSEPKRQPQGPVLLDRIVKSECQRVAVLGLHGKAGTRTVLASLVRELHRRQWPFAVTSAPRIPLESEVESGMTTRLALPEGAVLATAPAPPQEGDATLELMETTDLHSAGGPIGIHRVTVGGEVDLHGPDDPDAMEALLRRLGTVSGGLVFVDGSWERRAFAAPGVTDGLVLALGAGLSATPERSAAAVRYLVEMFTVEPCDEAARVAWEETASGGAAALLDERGRPLGLLPPGLADPVQALRGADGTQVSTVVLPHGVNDEFMVSLVRSHFRCHLVVRDATRINIAPIYFKAWFKGGGTIRVVRRTNLVGVATNPINQSGPDADPVKFRQSVAEALPALPVHDVVLESGEEPRKPIWKFWE
jgi:hypothetical protein